MRQAPLPIPNVDEWPILFVPNYFTAKNFDDMHALLAKYRDGLIKEPPPEQDNPVPMPRKR
jgi:hypothetical protein